MVLPSIGNQARHELHKADPSAGSGASKQARRQQQRRRVERAHGQVSVAADLDLHSRHDTPQRVVRGNGNVIDSKLLKPSGNTALDRSVKRALDRVRFVAPFPEGSLDPQRTFTINFNLKSKRFSG